MNQYSGIAFLDDDGVEDAGLVFATGRRYAYELVRHRMLPGVLNDAPRPELPAMATREELTLVLAATVQVLIDEVVPFMGRLAADAGVNRLYLDAAVLAVLNGRDAADGEQGTEG